MVNSKLDRFDTFYFLVVHNVCKQHFFLHFELINLQMIWTYIKDALSGLCFFFRPDTIQ